MKNAAVKSGFLSRENLFNSRPKTIVNKRQPTQSGA